MDLVASFKASRFRREKEWRIVCRPSLALNSSAPGLERERFQHFIKGDHKHHVELQTPAPARGTIISGHTRSAVPFCSIYRPDDFRNHDEEFLRIRKMLEENDRRDIKLAYKDTAGSLAFMDPRLLHRHPVCLTVLRPHERCDKLSRRLSSRSKSNRRLAAAAFRKLRIPTRKPTTTVSTTRMSASLIDIDVGEERCHTLLR
jgi:hypothetical protein